MLLLHPRRSSVRLVTMADHGDEGQECLKLNSALGLASMLSVVVHLVWKPREGELGSEEVDEKHAGVTITLARLEDTADEVAVSIKKDQSTMLLRYVLMGAGE